MKDHTGQTQNSVDDKDGQNASRKFLTLPETVETFGTVALSFVGWSNSGKTTFLSQVINHLTSTGLRVALIKHHAHMTDIDIPESDSWHFARAGAQSVFVSSPTQYSLIRQVAQEKTCAELCAEAAKDADIVITEGYKSDILPKIELSRQEHDATPVCDLGQCIALVTNNQHRADEAEPYGIPVFSLDQAEVCADFLRDLIAMHRSSHHSSIPHLSDK